jgi:hypothetical protein
MAYISPRYQQTDFPSGLSLGQKIQVFEDRVRGWQLDIAEKCRASSEHSGYGVLHIITSYFEMIAKYEDGFVEKGRSAEYFKRGVLLVFPSLRGHKSGVSDQVLNGLYEGLRCGLYHGGGTEGNILVTWNQNDAMRSTQDGRSVMINPDQIVQAVKTHFDGYLQQLRDLNNVELRNKFQRRFDFSS